MHLIFILFPYHAFISSIRLIHFYLLFNVMFTLEHKSMILIQIILPLHYLHTLFIFLIRLSIYYSPISDIPFNPPKFYFPFLFNYIINILFFIFFLYYFIIPTIILFKPQFPMIIDISIPEFIYSAIISTIL